VWEAIICVVSSWDKGDKECMWSFGGETSWKMVIWRTKIEMEDSIKIHFGRWMKLAQDHVHWRALSLILSLWILLSKY
jgi:hypothetical protein